MIFLKVVSCIIIRGLEEKIKANDLSMAQVVGNKVGK
jgi:hypothetical protein